METEEETTTIDFIDAAGRRGVSRLSESEQMGLRMLTIQETRNIREIEEAAIEGELPGASRRGLRCGSHQMMGEEQETRRYRREDQAGKEVAVSTSEEIGIGQMAIRFRLEGEESGGSVAVFEFDVPAGARVPAAHSHDAFEETIYGLEGVLSWTLEGTKTDVGAGDVLCIRRGVVHRFDNDREADAKMLAIVSPGILGPEYFREIARVVGAATGGPPDTAAIAEVMRRHGLTPAP